MSSVPFSHDTYNPTITHKTTQHDASPSSPTVHNTHDHQCTYLERRDGLVEVVALLVADVEPHQALRRIAGVGPWHLAAHHLDEARAFVGLAVDDVLVLLVGVRVVVVCVVEGSGFTNRTQGVRAVRYLDEGPDGDDGAREDEGLARAAPNGAVLAVD